MPAKAIDYYMRAGNETALRFASRDALASYERALALLARVQLGSERDERELSILNTIGQLLIRMPFSGDPIHTYQRTIDLARSLNDIPRLYAGLANMCIRHVIRAEYDSAVEVCTERAGLARDHTIDPVLAEYGTNVQALTAIYRGELTAALELFERLARSTAASETREGPIHRAALHGPIVRAAIARAYAAIAHCLRGEGQNDHAT